VKHSIDYHQLWFGRKIGHPAKTQDDNVHVPTAFNRRRERLKATRAWAAL
jgi:hypothetical protein